MAIHRSPIGERRMIHTSAAASPVGHLAQRSIFQADVLAGLHKPAKTLPCKYFYDARGSDLFEEICGLAEYYPTRTELAILKRSVEEMAILVEPRCLLIEFGSGSGTKTRLLLDHLSDPAAYVPVDISRDALRRSARALSVRYPKLPIYPLCVDFAAPFSLPELGISANRRVVYFPGSTVGNFGPADAKVLLFQIAQLCGPGGGLLIGADLKKDLDILLPAYNDSRGVTAAFNLNLLTRINSELGADFHVESFRHEAIYNEDHGRIEMYVICERAQTVQIGQARISFSRGERICTEHSYKYDVEQLPALAATAGFRLRHLWLDERRWFSVQYLSLP
jgi:dimethylhistidine N-methyltransferase